MSISTALKVTSSANDSVYGKSVSFAAAVTSDDVSGVAATGTVAFYVDSTEIGSAVSLSSGTASISDSSLTVGTHTITAEYSGDTNYAASNSAPFQQLVIDTTLASGVSSAPPNQPTPAPLTTGSLVLPISDAGLTYISGSNGNTTVAVDASVATTYDSEDLTYVTAELTLGGYNNTVNYIASGVAADTNYRFAVPIDGHDLATGSYSYTMTVTGHYVGGGTDPATIVGGGTGSQDVLNLNSSPFGQGWSLDGLDSLVIADSGSLVTLVQSDGTMGDFTATEDGAYSSPAGPLAFMSLQQVTTGDTVTYQLTGTDGTMETFSSTGTLEQVEDHDGNITQYTPASGAYRASFPIRSPIRGSERRPSPTRAVPSRCSIASPA